MNVLKYKQHIIILLFPLIVLGGIWQFFSDKASKALQHSLVAAAEQKFNGRVHVGTIDFSLMGWIRIRDVKIYDLNSQLIASSPIIEIKYQWRNLFRRDLGITGVEVVTVQGAEVWLKNQKQRWNWEGLVKAKDSDQDSVEDSAGDFKGKIMIDETMIHIGNDSIVELIEGVNGAIDFSTYPAAVGIDLKGRVSQARLSVSGKWSASDAGELVLHTDGFDLSKLSGLLPATQDIKLAKGILKDAKIVVKRDAERAMHYQAEGAFSALTLTGKIDIRDGQGNFAVNNNELKFNNLIFYIFGQKAEGNGRILLQGGNPMLNFDLKLPDVDPAALYKGLTVQRPLFVAMNITGPLTKPAISGRFTLPQISVSNMSVSTVAGNMQYSDGRLSLRQVQGSALQGQLTASGEILTTDESYELDLTGQGMDSTALTDKDVQGPLDFTGHISGRGGDAVTKGEFVIRNGKAYGIAFETLTGKFIKKGDVTDISGVAIRTVFGTFYPEQLSRAAMEKLSQYNIPASKDEVKKAVTESLMKKLFR